MSGVPYGSLRSISARELSAALLREGFRLIHQTGSHRRYAHSDGRRATVPYSSPGDTFATATLRSIIERQACWTRADLKRIGLMRS